MNAPAPIEHPVAAEYKSLVHALAETAAQRSAQARTIEKTYLDGCANAARAVTGAAAAVSAAAADARAAAGLVTDADADAATLWRELGRVLGRRGARLGPLPAPEAVAETDPAVPLTRAADLIAAAERATPRKVPAAAYPALFLLGAVCATAIALPAKGLLAALGGTLAVAILAQIVIFVAPFVGLPVARAWVRTRWRTPLQFGGFVVTALGGMIACCSLVALL